MKKIVFGITNLNIGGAEKTLVALCNELCNNYDITIFTLYSKGILEKELSDKIKLISLYNKSFEQINYLQKKSISFKLLFFKKFIYNKYIKNKFDVEIAFLEGPITNLFSIQNKKSKKYAWIHTDISLIFGNNLKSKIKKMLNKKIYTKYTKLIFVSKNSLEKFNTLYDIKTNKQVIYNYLNIDKVIKKSKEKITGFPKDGLLNLLIVARLVEAKAIDRLIDVHAKLIKNEYLHRIYVIGDGPLRNNLQDKIKKSNVSNTFILLGEKENPYPYIDIADYFCLLSYYEGFPMTLLEAKVLNKYIIITNTSATEALNNYSNKTILENSEKDIYNGLEKIIKNKNSGNIQYDFNKENKNNLNEIINLLK